MNLIIDREELIRGLSRVQGIVERRTTNLALAHVLLSAEGNTLRLTATDTMVSLVADYVARIEHPGEISVDAQNLFQVARHLPESTVHLKVEAGNRLAIHSGKSEFHLVGMSAEDYPPLPSRDDQAALNVAGSTLHRLISETLYAVCTDDSRYGLNASVWTKSRHRGRELARSIDSGCAVVNDCMITYGVTESPFGGVKESGMGREGGSLGLMDYLDPKYVKIKLAPKD